jgi:hypothetical protein
LYVPLNNAVVSTYMEDVALLVEFKVVELTLAPDEFDPLPDAFRPFAQPLFVARPSSTLMISRGSCVQSMRFVKHTHTQKERQRQRHTVRWCP